MMATTRMYLPAVSLLVGSTLLAGCEASRIAQVKEGVLTDYPTAKVGDAFDSYDVCRATSWSSTTTDRGEEIVEYVCAFDVPAATAKIEEAIPTRCQQLVTLASVGMATHPGAGCVRDLTARVKDLNAQGAEIVVQFAILQTQPDQFTVKATGFRDLDGNDIDLGAFGELAKLAILPRIYGADISTWGTFSPETFLDQVVEGWQPSANRSPASAPVPSEAGASAAADEAIQAIEEALKADLRNAIVLQETYFADNGEYAGQDDLAPTWRPSPETEVISFQAAPEGFTIGLRRGTVTCSVTVNGTGSGADGVPMCVR